jgi:hypothetical protein
MIDLEAIFGDAPEATIDIVPASLAADNAPALEEAPDSPTAAADTPDPAPTGEPDAGEDPFDGWVLRPDVTGRLGWEPPGLPEEERWWARARFEDLPTLAAYFPGSMDRPEGGRCDWCGRSDWWRSKAWPDVVRCGWCFPPVPGLPVEWLNRSEAGPVEKPLAQEAGCCVSAGSVDV